MFDKIRDKLNHLSDNDRIVYKNVIGAFLVKGGALLITLFTLPAYIDFFNNDEVLGVWFTILSLLNWILNFDLGIGNGLRNHLSESLASGDNVATKKYISSAYASIGAIVLSVSALFPIVISCVDLNSVFSIDRAMVSPKSLYITLVIVFIGVMIQFWLKLINSVLYAMQKSSINNFLVLCTNTIILVVALVFPSGSNETNVIVMAVVHAVAVALPLLIASIVVFGGRLRFAIPNIKFVTKQHIKQVLSLGGMFFILQLAYMVIMSTNEFLITKTSGNAYVVEYQAYYKLFSLGSTVFALALTPIWSVITKAKAEKNYAWIEATYKRFMLLATIFAAGEFVIIPLMNPLMNIWLGEDALPSVSIFTGVLFAILGCLMIVNSVLSSITNGLGKLKIQSVCFLLGAVAKIPLSYFLVGIMNSWNGVVLSNIVCVGLYCIIQPLVIKKTIYEE
ncbi:MAG: MATE family efflux transporter [Oscillospiraceae bacterium]|nr:MATE family efflux transporter [Oscillospiraceae bacterium]